VDTHVRATMMTIIIMMSIIFDDLNSASAADVVSFVTG
jgi:hypothetical protein